MVSSGALPALHPQSKIPTLFYMKQYETVHPAPLSTEDLPRLLVEESPAFPAARAFYTPELVTVDRVAAASLASGITSGPSHRGMDTCEEWGSEERAFVPYFLMLNSVNFKFWSVDSSGRLDRYEAWGATGSVAMSRGMRGLFHAVESIWRAPHTSEDTAHRLVEENFDAFLPSIPDREARLRCLLDVAGRPHLLRSASKAISRRVHDRSRLTPVDILSLVESFPLAYGSDPFCKRAQLALMMVAARYSAYGHRIALPGFSAAADYQLPKVLRAEGVLVYAPELEEWVDNGVELSSGSPEETAIRAATILACDLLVRLSSLDTVTVDHWLWTRREKYASARFHLTSTTDY